MTGAPPDHFPALLARLQQLGGDAAAAVRTLELAHREHPRDPRVLLLLAAERVHASDVDGAEGAYIAALQQAPDLHVARFQLGLLQLTSGRPGAALATWAPLHQLDENHPLHLFARGLACVARDEFPEARRLLAQGIARNTDNQPLTRDMRMVLERISGPGQGAGAEPPHEGDAPASSAHYLVSSYKRS